MSRMPDDVRDRLRDAIWTRADELGWSTLADGERSGHYERWTRDPNIGGTLGHYMDPRKVRVYIKDSLLKPYERARLSGSEHQILNSLAVPADSESRSVTSNRTASGSPTGVLFPGATAGTGSPSSWRCTSGRS